MQSPAEHLDTVKKKIHFLQTLTVEQPEHRPAGTSHQQKTTAVTRAPRKHRRKAGKHRLFLSHSVYGANKQNGFQAACACKYRREAC